MNWHSIDSSGKDDTGFNWAAYIVDAMGKELKDQLKEGQSHTLTELEYRKPTVLVCPSWYAGPRRVDYDGGLAILYHLQRPIRQRHQISVAWLQGHGGNFDVREAFAWIASIFKANP